MVVRHFKVHLAYARVVTKWLCMCGTHKIFHAAGFIYACHAHHMYNDAPVPTLAIAYFLS